MDYRNISDKAQLIVVNSVKTSIPSGSVVNLEPNDIRHSGSNIRHFESVHKAQEIVDDLFRRKVESRRGGK